MGSSLFPVVPSVGGSEAAAASKTTRHGRLESESLSASESSCSAEAAAATKSAATATAEALLIVVASVGTVVEQLYVPEKQKHENVVD